MTGVLAGKRIGLLSTWASRRNGGVFEAVVAQASLLQRLGASPIVFALAQRDSDEDLRRFGDLPVVLVRQGGPALLGSGPAMTRRLLEARLDCLHLHGIWQLVSAAGANWARRTGKPYLISPHGMLDPWILSHGRLKKAAARLVYERRSWRAARLFHALTAREAGDIAAATGRDNVTVIPNSAPPADQAQISARAAEIAYLGRIHPKKNLLALVAAWDSLGAKLPSEARLTIAGWGEPGDVAALEARLVGVRNARFIGPVFGKAKRDLLHRARFTVLPSLSEGLPMAMLESWAASCPTLMSEACNLPEGFAAGAALDCGTGVASIATAIELALALPDEDLRRMADAAQHLAATRFGAATVAQAWAAAYAGVLA